MNIAMFTDSYTPYVSGVVRSIQRFTSGLIAQGHQVYIFAPKYSKEAMKNSEDESTQTFRFLSVPALTLPAYALPIPISPKSSSLMKELEIDIIHTHSPFLTGRLGANLARKCQIPLIFTHHTLYHEYAHYIIAPRKVTHQAITKYLQRYFRHCDHVITPTPLIKDFLIDFYQLEQPITTIPTGIDLSGYKTADKNWLRNKFKIDPSKRIILFVSRLSAEKNIQLVMEAFLKLYQDIPDLHMVFVGDGSEKANLQKFSAKYALENDVTFTGAVNATEVINCYCAAELFMFGSTTETQGLVLAEAMAGGVPVVAVKATGTNDIVEHGVNGFLTENSVDSLVEHAKIILSDQSIWESMHDQALQTADKLSIEKTTERLVSLYNETIANF